MHRIFILIWCSILNLSVYSQDANTTAHGIDWVVQTNLVRPLFGDVELGLQRRDKKNGDILVFGRFI
ncbi:hypothetical protein N8368_02455 [Bacteroidia bacterium]|nr:hypothetical protein [Bacteroidia bacterium]MDC1395350.1 hypothetical protein [Bacteroidia bacterium]